MRVHIAIYDNDGKIAEEVNFELGSDRRRDYMVPVILDESRALVGWTFHSEVREISPTRGIEP